MSSSCDQKWVEVPTGTQGMKPSCRNSHLSWLLNVRRSDQWWWSVTNLFFEALNVTSGIKWLQRQFSCNSRFIQQYLLISLRKVRLGVHPDVCDKSKKLLEFFGSYSYKKWKGFVSYFIFVDMQTTVVCSMICMSPLI